MHGPTRLSTRDLVLVFVGRLVSSVILPSGISLLENISRQIFIWVNLPNKMDVADRTTGVAHVRDDLAEQCQKLFQDFLEE